MDDQALSALLEEKVRIAIDAHRTAQQILIDDLALRDETTQKSLHWLTSRVNVVERKTKGLK